MALTAHPDRGGDETEFAMLHEAYEVLIDERCALRLYLHQALSACSQSFLPHQDFCKSSWKIIAFIHTPKSTDRACPPTPPLSRNLSDQTSVGRSVVIFTGRWTRGMALALNTKAASPYLTVWYFLHLGSGTLVCSHSFAAKLPNKEESKYYFVTFSSKCFFLYNVKQSYGS
jgi:hypothetical protein